MFDAPRELIWDMFTKPEHVSKWMLGPEGWTMPVCEIDPRPGGKWRWVWRKSDGETMEMTGEYCEVVPPERLVNTENWGDDWPETTNILLLTEENGRTLTVQTVRFPSRGARDRGMQTGMNDGWAVSHDRLDAYLQEGLK